jgi:DNA-binding NtrC family response regulator
MVKEELKAMPHAPPKKDKTKALRVLVVEDDNMIGMLLGWMLEDMGHQVCSIEASEADAVTAAAQYHPDLLIVDAWLGDGSGVIAVDEILRRGYVPHLFISGNIGRVKAVRPDATMLEKPFGEAALARAIQQALAVGTGGTHARK